jgi:hypothetical protein
MFCSITAIPTRQITELKYGILACFLLKLRTVVSATEQDLPRGVCNIVPQSLRN